MTIVLASTSSIRAKLLRAAGVQFTTARPEIDEVALREANPMWASTEIAGKLAEAKAIDVSMRMPGLLVIGADQTLLFGVEFFGKPRDIAEARLHLRRLRGRTHELQSALCCALNGEVVWVCADQALLTMRAFTDNFLESYLAEAGDDCLTSVGAYKLEERGIQLFEKITGSYHTILGLPLLPLLAFLRSRGIVAA